MSYEESTVLAKSSVHPLMLILRLRRRIFQIPITLSTNNPPLD